MIEMMNGERESRTGITRLNQGLDAEALNLLLYVRPRLSVRADVVEHGDDTVGLESDAGLGGHFGS